MKQGLIIVLLLSTNLFGGVRWDLSRFNGEAPENFKQQSPPTYDVDVQLIISVDHSPRIGFYETTLKVSSATEVSPSWTPNSEGQPDFIIVERSGKPFIIDYGSQGFDIDVEAVVYRDDIGGNVQRFYHINFTIPYEEGRTIVIDLISGNWFGRLAIPGPNDDLPYLEFTFAPQATACLTRPLSDSTGDCVVNLQDLSLLVTEWLTCGLSDPLNCPV